MRRAACRRRACPRSTRRGCWRSTRAPRTACCASSAGVALSLTLTLSLSLSLSLSLTLSLTLTLTSCAALGFLGPARTLGASTDSNPNPIL